MTDREMLVGRRADVLVPHRRMAPIAPHDRPGARERVVDRRDLVVQDIGIGLVEADALLDDRRVVRVERRAVRVM